MKKLLYLLLLTVSGCVYPAYTVRRPLPTEPPVSREEIERLSNAGVSEPVMFDLIEKRGAAPLSPDDLVALKKAQVSDTVVQKAIASERKIVERVIIDDYAYPGYYYPYYGASFGYGVGWGYPYYYHGYCYPRGYVGVRVYR